MTAVFDKIIDKSHFPKVESLTFELKKIALIRILVGFITFYRFFQIAFSYYIYTGEIHPLSITVLTLSFFFLIGFITPLSTVLLMFFAHYSDIVFGTSTLGTIILSEALIVFFLTNSGNFFSIDRLLFNAGKPIKRLIDFIYCQVVCRNVRDITRAYFLAFCLYAFVSFAALALHLNDEYWVNGLTVKSLLSNAYLCYYWEFFRWFESNFPIIVSIISISGSIFQSVFQFLMLPLIFLRWGRVFVVFWGLLFFVISLFFINLSYLPHIELALWTLIFFPIKSKEQIIIFYDNHCNLCKRSMKILKLLNFNNSIQFKPISNNLSYLLQKGYSEAQIKSYMVGEYKGKDYIGFDLYYVIIFNNPIYWIFVPFFILGKAFNIGKKVYNYIAERRYRLFGTCELSFEDEIARPYDIMGLSSNSFIKKIVYLTYLVIIFIFVFIKFPYFEIIKYKIIKDKKIVTLSNTLLKISGLERPDVFNKTDLEMGNGWAELYSKDDNTNSFTLVPITGLNGERLNYEGCNYLFFSNHNSDFLYFGCTLKYAREFIQIKKKKKEDIVEAHKNGLFFENIKKRIIYDYNKRKLKGKMIYKVLICSNNSSIVEHWSAGSGRHTKKILAEILYSYDGNNCICLAP